MTERSAKSTSRPLAKMMAVITVAWALILSESYLFFFVIRPTAPNIHLSITSEILKVGSVGLLAVFWVVVLYVMERRLFRAPGT